MEKVEHSTKKKMTGTIVSNKMQNTVVVKVEGTIQHPRYGKVIKRSQKYYAHSNDDSLQIGDSVVITETRPISKLKRWLVIEKL